MLVEGISVIVTTKNNADSIKVLLDSIENQTYKNTEVIVIDNHSTDHTLEIARSMGALCYTFGPERSSQRNRGAELASHDTLIFLDSDMELTEHVIESCMKEIHNNDALCVKEVVIAGSNYWAKVRSFEKGCYYHSLYFEAARCTKRDVFFKLGGYDPSLTGLEDMALQASLIKQGVKIGWVSDEILHHEEKVDMISYLRKRRWYGKTDKTFASEFPAYWRILRSPVKRWESISETVRKMDKTTCLYLLPGVFLSRVLEIGVRATLFLWK